MSSPKASELIEELSSENVNILKVKILCKEYPGLIASAGLRIKIWTLLLLGNTASVNLDRNIDDPEEECDEQQVLDADVPRTRSDIEEFRSAAWRTSVKNILQKFCITHGVQYKQGMNEVLIVYRIVSLFWIVLQWLQYTIHPLISFATDLHRCWHHSYTYCHRQRAPCTRTHCSKRFYFATWSDLYV